MIRGVLLFLAVTVGTVALAVAGFVGSVLVNGVIR